MTTNQTFYESNFDHVNEVQPAFVSKTVQIDSEGDVIVNKILYPRDIVLSQGTVINNTAQRLIGQNMLNVPVINITLQNNKIIGATFTEFDSLGSKVYPKVKYVADLSVPLTNEADLYQVDGAGKFVYFQPKEHMTFEATYSNLLESKPDENITASFVWGYAHRTLVTAHAVNAQANEIAFSSFEDANHWGNWSFTTGNYTLDTTETHTGKQSFLSQNNTTSLQNANPLPQQDYKLSFWKKGPGTVTVTGADTVVLLKTVLGWSLYEATLLNKNLASITIPNGVRIDDLRLHPADAQMSTFTHRPLVGITTKTDAKHQAIYYEYDGFNRLKYLRDFEGNILKRYTYQYKNKQ
ncbi:hypothetical protein BKI52_37390 [marine bacterium AO1-C]|nr:hypothetical protein BKI52_37390 [marine bacterium AO1-C]